MHFLRIKCSLSKPSSWSKRTWCRENEELFKFAQIRLKCSDKNVVSQNGEHLLEIEMFHMLKRRNKSDQIKKFKKNGKFPLKMIGILLDIVYHAKNVCDANDNLDANLIKLNANYNKLFSAFRTDAPRRFFVRFQCVCVCLFMHVKCLSLRFFGHDLIRELVDRATSKSIRYYGYVFHNNYRQIKCQVKRRGKKKE